MDLHINKKLLYRKNRQDKHNQLMEAIFDHSNIEHIYFHCWLFLEGRRTLNMLYPKQIHLGKINKDNIFHLESKFLLDKGFQK